MATSPLHPEWHVGTPDNPVTYDGNDNILSLSQGGQVESDSYYPGTNRLKSNDQVSNEFVYDANGNVINALPRGLQLTYDPFTQMATTIDVAGDAPKKLSFSYEGNNRRVLKTVAAGGTTSSRLYVRGISDYPQIERTKASNGDESIVSYVYGPAGLVAMIVDDRRYYILRDHERSTRVVLDESGKLAAVYDYFPFGIQDRSFGPEQEIIPYRYTGQEYDGESGLYNYRARMYDADLGRFFGPDPKRQYPSPYVYVGDEPIRLTDPTGESVWSVFDDVLSFAIDAVEVGAAVAVEVGTLGGGTTVAGGLMGAAVSGISYTATHLNEGNAGKFWGGYGISEATGALAGALTGGVGGIETSLAKQVALGVGAGVVGAEIDHVGENLGKMAEGEDADWSDKGFGMAALVGGLGGGLGTLAGAGVGKGLSNLASKGLKTVLAFAAGAAIEGGLTAAAAGIQGEKVDWLEFSLNAAAGGISAVSGARGEARRQAAAQAQRSAEIEMTAQAQFGEWFNAVVGGTTIISVR